MSAADAREIASFNVVRGAAALAVCASHLRAYLFLKFPDLIHPSAIDRVFYFFTGLGHEAVMVFFVMSGWLVGGSVVRQMQAERFSWTIYFITRLSRLWIVLIPALAITALADNAGIWLFHGIGYDGSRADALLSGPTPAHPISLSPGTFVGNILFLQTIVVPVLGTNGPLWSLANEFWYYVMFPCFAAACRRGSPLRSLALTLIGLTILVALPVSIRFGFFLWLLGWLGVTFYSYLPERWSKALTLASLATLFATLAYGKLRHNDLSDGLIAAATTLLLMSLRRLPDAVFSWRSLKSGAAHLAHISYTLYLVHFPILALLFFSLRLPQYPPSVPVYVSFFILLALTLVVSSLIWLVFERRTDALRKYLTDAFAKRSLRVYSG